jgi:hypothetical protein
MQCEICSVISLQQGIYVHCKEHQVELGMQNRKMRI